MKLPTPEQITRSLEELLRRPGQMTSRHNAREARVRSDEATWEHRAKGAQKPRKLPRERPARRLHKVERRPADKKNILARVVTGLSLAGLTILLIVVNPYAFALEAMFFLAIAMKEMCDLAARFGVNASFFVALPAGLAGVVVASWKPSWMAPVFAVSVVFAMICMTFRWPTIRHLNPATERRTRFLDGAMTVFAFAYTAWLFSFCLPIRLIGGQVPGLNGSTVDLGAALLLMLITTTALSDVGCYALGSIFGRHALAPTISPGKTIEGSLGGVLVSVIAAVAFGRWVGLGAAACVAYGVIISVVAQIGDLWESILKREAGVKDSGRVLAGHGGVLDRFDSFFFAMPVGYLLTRFLFH